MAIERKIARVQPLPATSLQHPIPLGTYEGGLASTSLDAAAGRAGIGRLARIARQKRWQWLGVMAPEVALGAALVKTGYAAQIFLWVFDRQTKEMLVDTSKTLPRPRIDVSQTPNARGDIASYKTFGQELRLEMGANHWKVICNMAGVEAELEFFPTSEEMQAATAICPVPGNGIHMTQKQAGLRASGTLKCNGTRFNLTDDAWGYLDYSHGFLARETSWKWAIGGGLDTAGEYVGFNMVSGFNQGLENVLWRGGVLYTLPRVEFTFNTSQPDEPWHVRSKGGEVDLTLDVDGIRSEDIDLAMIKSSYVQPLGRWSGRLGEVEVDGVFGVAEDHQALW